MFRYLKYAAVILPACVLAFVLFLMVRLHYHEQYKRPEIEVIVRLADQPAQPVDIELFSKTEEIKESARLGTLNEASFVFQPIVVQGQASLMPGDRYIKTEILCRATGYHDLSAYVSLHGAGLIAANPASKFKIEIEMRPTTSMQRSTYTPYRYDHHHKTWGRYGGFILPP